MKARIFFQFPEWPMIGRMTNVAELTCDFLTDKADIKDIAEETMFNRYFAGMSGLETMQNALFCRITLPNGERWVVKDRTGLPTPYLEP